MRIAIGIEYDGTGFLGWQEQREGATVQGAIERALSRVADHAVEVVCAGRTDSGVHARCQVAHFDSDAARDARAWMLGANSLLPAGISVVWVRPVEPDFHARYSAAARSYEYTIVNRSPRPALGARYAAWERVPLDANAMHVAAQALLGEHDFSAFRAVSCQSRSPKREVQHVAVERSGEIVRVAIRANAFLHHMVRNIVGSLIVVGRGEQPVAWLASLLASRDRTRAGATAPPEGLVFVGPLYPLRFGLPAEVSGDVAERVRGPVSP